MANVRDLPAARFNIFRKGTVSAAQVETLSGVGWPTAARREREVWLERYLLA
jgi:hypothetical protein